MGVVPWEPIGKYKGAKDASKEQRKLARETYERQQKAIDAHDWNPELVSERAPQYQRTESPVARGYLESFLTGTNPDAIQGTRAGAQFAKKDAQAAFNTQTGGWDALRAKQAELNDSSRFHVAPIERDVQNADKRAGLRYPDMAGSGLSVSQIEYMLEQNPGLGMKYDENSGQIQVTIPGLKGGKGFNVGTAEEAIAYLGGEAPEDEERL